MNFFKLNHKQLYSRRERELIEAQNELMTAQAQLERAKHNVALFTERVDRLLQICESVPKIMKERNE